MNKTKILVGSTEDIFSKTEFPGSSFHDHIYKSGHCRLSLYNEEVLDIARTLQLAGYSPCIVYGMRDLGEYAYVPLCPELIQEAKELGIPSNGSVERSIMGLVKQRGLISLSQWPRDFFVQEGGKLYVNSLTLRNPRRSVHYATRKGHGNLYENGVITLFNIIEKIVRTEQISPETPLEKEMIESIFDSRMWAEGGRWLSFNDFIIVSHVLQRYVPSTLDQSNPALSRKSVYFVKPTTVRIGDQQLSPSQFRYHIDYQINGLDTIECPLVLVDPDFYQMNQSVLQQIARNHGVRYVFVAEEERHVIPANFLVLPDRKIVMSPDTPRTKGRLEERIGEENVLTTEKPLKELLRARYGIRCMTNSISEGHIRGLIQ